MKANSTGHETKDVVCGSLPRVGKRSFEGVNVGFNLDKNAQCGGHRELKFVPRKARAGVMSTAAAAFSIDRRERLNPELCG